jgi:CheY-like chemotaxis protein
VSEAATGAEALRLARLQPDLILLDLRLPDVDGFEVCRRLKQDPATKGIAVVYRTAYMDERTRATREGTCADEIIVDDGDSATLLRAIARLLAKT